MKASSTTAPQKGIAFIPWLPIAGGDHAGPPQLATIAAEVGGTATQVALAWLLHRSPVVVPIPGTSSEQHLVENAEAAGIRLSDSQLAQLAAVG